MTPNNPAHDRINGTGEPQPFELAAAPTRDDWHRWTVAEALAVLKAAEARLHAFQDAEVPEE